METHTFSILPSSSVWMKSLEQFLSAVVAKLIASQGESQSSKIEKAIQLMREKAEEKEIEYTWLSYRVLSLEKKTLRKSACGLVEFKLLSPSCLPSCFPTVE